MLYYIFNKINKDLYNTYWNLSFEGCNANLFYADAPKPQLEVLTDAFWDYIAKATQTADDALDMIRESPIGQEIK